MTVSLDTCKRVEYREELEKGEEDKRKTRGRLGCCQVADGQCTVARSYKVITLTCSTLKNYLQ